MRHTDIRSTFLEFFEDRGHRRISGSSLIPPPGDPVLFTTSGMHPLTPYLEGRPHPTGRRLVDLQRCLRTTDLDEVGDLTHLTVFGMLGSWSLGDYGGPDSLRWGYDLLTGGFGVDPGRLHVTVFGGDGHLGPDESSWRVWDELGVPVEPTRGDNWWSNGHTGPCGPDSEIFVWTGDGRPTGSPTTDRRWVEVWNHVMMRYRRLPDGSLVPLEQQVVDTGMGLERLSMVLGGHRSVYETDLLTPWTDTVGQWGLSGRALRVVSDHLRSSVVVVGDGVRPSSTGRGHVLRRVLRRTLTTLWRNDPDRSLGSLSVDLVGTTLGQLGQPDTEVGTLLTVLVDEERRFGRLLERGRTLVRRQRSRGPLTELDLRYLHETHGLPPDLVRGILAEEEAERPLPVETLGGEGRLGLQPLDGLQRRVVR